jgi:hypothetical protein
VIWVETQAFTTKINPTVLSFPMFLTSFPHLSLPFTSPQTSSDADRRRFQRVMRSCEMAIPLLGTVVGDASVLPVGLDPRCCAGLTLKLRWSVLTLFLLPSTPANRGGVCREGVEGETETRHPAHLRIITVNLAR